MLSIYIIVTYRLMIFAHKYIHNAKPNLVKDLGRGRCEMWFSRTPA